MENLTADASAFKTQLRAPQFRASMGRAAEMIRAESENEEYLSMNPKGSYRPIGGRVYARMR